MNPVLPGPPLRIAVLGDFDGPHTRSWLGVFVERGHDVHAISYYPPRAELPGVTLHVLKPRPASAGEAPAERPGLAQQVANLLPRSVLRYAHARRYRRAGLRRLLDEVHPDVFHAHYAVEHGYYGAVGYHPYVVSAWGSDLLIESYGWLNRRIARHALLAADLVTGNDASLVYRAVTLGVSPDRAAVVHLGIDPCFLKAGERSVNLQSPAAAPARIITYRALEQLYNVDTVITAFNRVHPLTQSSLTVAGDGSEMGRLRGLAQSVGAGPAIEFAGRQEQAWLADSLAQSQVYVSVPNSDSLALSNLEAMAAGAFPIVSDLPSVHGWIEDGVNGFRVPPRDIDALASALLRALNDHELRRSAALYNRRLVEARGLREPNMLLMERYYYRLAGHPVEEGAI